MSTLSSAAQLKLQADGRNFLVWSTYIRNLMAENEIEFNENNWNNNIKGKDGYLKKNGYACRIIMMNVAVELQPIAVSEPDAWELFKLFEKKFSLLDGDARLDKLIRLFTGKKSNDENINTYIARKRALFNDLNAGITFKAEASEKPMGDELLKVSIIAGLKSDQIAEIKKLSNVSLSTLESRLNSPGTLLQPIEIFGTKRKTTKSYERNDHKQCTVCSKRGHNESQCWIKNPNLKPKRTKTVSNINQEEEESFSNEVYLAFSTMTKGIKRNSLRGNQIVWILDSGAGTHVCNNKDAFQTLNTCETQLIVANGQKNTLNQIGDISIAGIKSLQLRNVVYAPQFKKNLISAGLLIKNGYEIMLRNDFSYILKDGEIICHLIRKNNLLVLDTRTIGMNVINFIDLKGKKIDNVLLHCRLGHPGSSAMEMLGIKKLDKKCEVCWKGEFPQIPYKSDNKNNYKSSSDSFDILEKIYVDLIGPLFTSFDGFKYILSIIDKKSRFSWVLKLKKKKEAYEKIKNWMTFIENQTKRRIKVLRSDRGTEFMNKQMTEFLETRGVKHIANIAYEHQQTGLVERFNRTIISKIRKILIQCNLTKKYWSEILVTANLIRNILPMRILAGETPHYCFYNYNFDYNILRSLGCKSIVRVHKEGRNKLSAQGEEMKFIGYNNDYQYKFMNSENKILLARNAIFIEDTTIQNQEIQIFDGQINKKSKIVKETEDEEEYFEIPLLLENKPSIKIEKFEHVVKNESKCEVSSQQIGKNASENIEKKEVTDQKEHVKKNNNDKEKIAPRESEEIKKANKKSVGREFLEISQGKQIGKRIPKKKIINIVEVYGIPKNYSEALHSKEKIKWEESMKEEIDSLIDCGTWEVCKIPPGKKLIPSKLVFDVKRNEKNEIVRYKSRVVAKGYLQEYGIDYLETYAPTLNRDTLKFLLTIAVYKGFQVNQFDVKTAFLHGKIEDEVILKPPPGFKVEKGQALRLKKCIYGLKQAPLVWNLELSKILKNVGFKQLSSDECVFTKGEDILCFHVDDILIMSKTKEQIQSYYNQLCKYLTINDLGNVNHFLGMKINFDYEKKRVELSQRAYIERILSDYGMSDCNGVSTPLEPNIRIEKNNEQSLEQDKSFIEMLGRLNYLSLVTRPDLSIVLTKLSRYANNPSKTHWEQLKRTLRYLKGTLNQKLILEPKNLQLSAHCDADWAMDIDDRRSTTGCAIFLGDALVTWRSKLQPTISLSTMEAEFRAIGTCVSLITWYKYFLQELGISQQQIQIFNDNRAAIITAKSGGYKGRAKHCEVHYHFIREKVKEENIVVLHISSGDNLADIFTKQIPAKKLCKDKSKLNLI